MESLMQSFKYNRLPRSWDSSARYPSKKSLSFWVDDLLKRHNQMDKLVSDLKTPKCLNITLLCNPMPFIIAFKQLM